VNYAPGTLVSLEGAADSSRQIDRVIQAVLPGRG
jgi:hypothetical protein